MAIKRTAKAGIHRTLVLPTLLLGLLSAGAAQAANGVCERIVVTGNPQYPPILWVDPADEKHLTGAAVDRDLLAFLELLHGPDGEPAEPAPLEEDGHLRLVVRLGPLRHRAPLEETSARRGRRR